MTESRFRVPHTLVLLFGMVCLAFLLTFILPQGSFQRAEEDGHEVVVPNSYTVDAERLVLPWYEVFTAIPRGFDAAKGIIFFVFIIGGAFGVFRATGAADALIASLLSRLGRFPFLLIAGGIVIFAVGSSTIGMAEEYLPFVPMLVALCVALNYDSITAIGILCVGYGIGYGTALINPFTVIIAKDIANVPHGSGLWYRSVLLLIFLVVGIHHVWRYAVRVRNDPATSLVADIPIDPTLQMDRDKQMTGSHVAVIVATFIALVVLIAGIIGWGWYLVEMGALFVAVTIILGVLGRLGLDTTAKEFCNGAAELTTTALLIGFARAIEVVLDDGRIVDTIVNGIAQPLNSLGAHAAAVGMLVVQSLCNFFIPSGSGQAYVTMPIMTPLADLVNVSRQTAVLAYQFGDGFMNILVPTNAVLIGILAIARIPYERWLRFIVPFMLKIWVLAAIALVVAVAIGFE